MTTQRIPSSPLTHRRPAQRRGVLLLVVLSILVMFMLVGTAFVLVGTGYLSGEKASAKASVAVPQQGDLLDRALRQVLRDTHNRNSSIAGQSVLRDMYGTDGFVAIALGNEANAVTPRYAGANSTLPLGPTNGQMIDIFVRDVDWDNSLNYAIPPLPSPTPAASAKHVLKLAPGENRLPVEFDLPRTDGYYSGCILTMLTGPAKGQSVRILEFEYLNDNLRTAELGAIDSALPRFVDEGEDKTYSPELFRIRVMAFPTTDGRTLTLDPTGGTNDLAGHTFMVNGRPFNGSGVGLNLLAGASRAKLTAYERLQADGGYIGVETALMPHARYFDADRAARFDETMAVDYSSTPGTTPPVYDPFFGNSQNALPLLGPLYNSYIGPGGADESYDAPDYQNMFLASSPLRPRARARVVSALNNRRTVEIAQYYRGGNTPDAPLRLDLDGLPIPSFHRPALVNYWMHRICEAPWFVNAEGNRASRIKAIIQPYGPDAIAGNADDPLGPGNVALAAQIANLKRKYILRPLREDHPAFDGGNPFIKGLDTSGFAQDQLMVSSGPSPRIIEKYITVPTWEVTGPWDVDNDGDEIPDSIWVDLGMPVQKTEDGRLYKPLFAILVQDLDGRLNLNAHGSGDHLAQLQHDHSGVIGFGSGTRTAVLQTNLADGIGKVPSGGDLFSSDQLPPGSGFGPADITLRPVLSPEWPGTDPSKIGDNRYDDYRRLLSGRPAAANAATSAATVTSRAVWGRYGGEETGITAAPGVPFDITNVNLSTLDTLPTLENSGAPQLSPAVGTQALRTSPDAAHTTRLLALGAGQPSGYGSMPDLRAQFAVGLDPAGQPVYESEYQAVNLANATTLLADSPYELELMNNARRGSVSDMLEMRNAYGTANSVDDDAPFSPGELEHLLRYHDADATSLPDRLVSLVDAFDAQKLAVQQYQMDPTRNGGNPDLTASFGLAMSSSELLSAQIEASQRRRSVTTESFDVPSTNENWTQRLVYGADGQPGIAGINDDGDNYPSGHPLAGQPMIDEPDETIVDPSSTEISAARSAGADDYVVVMGQQVPENARLVDYLRYRIVLELKRRAPALYPANMPASHPNLTAAVNLIINGDNTRSSANVRDVRASYGGLIAPEVLAGLKMDLNRPFGDGRDNGDGVDNTPSNRPGSGLIDESAEGPNRIDDDGDGDIDETGEVTDPLMNGIVDEPFEAGEAYIDANNNGRYDAGEHFVESNGVPGFQQSVDRLWEADNDASGTITVGEYTSFDYTNGQDANGSGTFTPTGERIRDDNKMARQLYARHLYCLALLNMDENYLAPYDSNDPQVVDYLDPDSEADPQFGKAASPAWMIAQSLAGDNDFDGTPAATDPQKAEAVRIARRKLTCRRIAQWAINCADMRDPDAIMTPFEYDENPWDGWNVVDSKHNRIYVIDGDIATDENRTYIRPAHNLTSSAPPNSAPEATWSTPAAEFYLNSARSNFLPPGSPRSSYATDEKGEFIPDQASPIEQTRGVVWGAERPELLITETFAFHDRKTEDRTFEDRSIDAGATDPNGDRRSPLNYKIGEALPPGDKEAREDYTMDQRMRPFGGAFVEIQNPWSDDGHKPAELYSGRDLDNADGDQNIRTGVDTPVGVDLALLSIIGVPGVDLNDDPITRYSPVWRMIAVEDHPRLRNDDELDDPKGTFQNKFPKIYEEYTEFKKPKMLALAKLRLGAGGNAQQAATPPKRAIVPDPDFPTFNQDVQPRVLRNTLPIQRSSLSGAPPYPAQVNRVQLNVPRQYVERAFYFTSNHDAARNPANLRVRIPLNRIKIPERLLPVMWRNYFKRNGGNTTIVGKDPKKSPTERLLWPEGMAIVSERVDGAPETFLEVFNHHFIPSYSELFQVKDSDDASLLEADLNIAPVLPGRFAVIGSAGYSYVEGRRSGKKRHEGRFITPLGRMLTTVDPENEYRMVVTGDEIDPETLQGGAGLGARRIELIPTPNPEAHQVVVGDNAGNESTIIDANNDATHDRNITSMFVVSARDDLQNGGLNRPVLAPGSAKRVIQPAVAIPVKGMSLSAPLDNYLLRWMELEPGFGDGGVPARDWEPKGAGGEGEYVLATDHDEKTPFDEPFDLAREIVENHTTPNYRTVHLQRLANPRLPWNPPPGEEFHEPTVPVNPYLTVDGSSVDLTSFNGSDPQEQTIGNQGGRRSAPEQPAYPAQLHEYDASLPRQDSEVIMTLASQQRGFQAANLQEDQPTARSPFQQEPPNLIDEIDTLRLRKSNAIHTPGGTKSQFVQDLNIVSTLSPRQHVLDYPLRHSLGFANIPLGSKSTFVDFYTQTDGEAYNEIDLDGDGIPGDLVGSPKIDRTDGSDLNDDTSTWLFWGNRPFASALEILQTPASSSSRLTAEFSTFNPKLTKQINPYNGFNQSDQVTTDINELSKANDARYAAEFGQFGHLANLFSNNPEPASYRAVGAVIDARGAANLHRMLGYLGVPSRYVGTKTLLSPAMFNSNSVSTPLDPRSDFAAPFNRVNTYREPGRVNVNTVVGNRREVYDGSGNLVDIENASLVYDGLMHRFDDQNLTAGSSLLQVGHRGPAWRDLVISRRGYTNPGFAAFLPNGWPGNLSEVAGDSSMMSLHKNVPTFFSNPFRESEEGMLVPLDNLTRSGSEATLLRSHPFTPGDNSVWGAGGDDLADGLENDANEAGLADDDDLFAANGLLENYITFDQANEPIEKTRVPLFSAGTTEASLNGQRNAALRYMPMTRLSSMTTTRSGTFAVWITVGFFEVSPAPEWSTVQDRFVGATLAEKREQYDRVYPEGYQLGKELGNDTGDINRHRGFWIIDRTQPVGFKPGDDVNLENIILLRRRIE